MKTYIKGRLYDTSTSRELAHWMVNQGDPYFHAMEVLYVKKNSEFFLFGHGGSGSRYAKPLKNGDWEEGSMIIPMTLNAAIEWAKTRLAPEQSEALFTNPKLTRDDAARIRQGKSYFTLFLPNETIELLRKSAIAEGKSPAAYVTELLKKGGKAEKKVSKKVAELQKP